MLNSELQLNTILKAPEAASALTGKGVSRHNVQTCAPRSKRSKTSLDITYKDDKAGMVIRSPKRKWLSAIRDKRVRKKNEEKKTPAMPLKTPETLR